MLLPMTKVQIIGTKDMLEATLRTLHSLGLLQIEDIALHDASLALTRMRLDADTLALQEEGEMLATRLESLLALLPVPTATTPPDSLSEHLTAKPTAALLAEVKKILDAIGPLLQRLVVRRDDLEAERASLPRYEATIRKIIPLAAELPELEGYETVALLIERGASGVLDLIRQELLSLAGDRFELTARDLDEQTTAAVLIFPKAQSTQVHGLLGRENISQVRLPKELAHASFRDALATIEARIAVIPDELDAIRTRLQDLAAQWYSSLALLRPLLRDRLQEIEVVANLGETRYTFILVGWTPRQHLNTLRDELARQVGPRVVVGELPISPPNGESVPVALWNPPVVQPFEFLVRLLALPKYGALDPTPLMALFMPIFFGMILGDVAYGVLVLILAGYLRHRFAAGALHSLAQVLLYCGVWTVIFGILFGELFGDIGHHLFGMQPVWLERRGEALPRLLMFSVGIGAFHIILGLLLGLWEALYRRSGKELCERLGKLIALIAVFWLIGVMTHHVPRTLFTPGVVFLIIGIVLLSTPLGLAGIILGPLEALGVVGNTLSYLRLGAIGLSSVYLAEVANQLYGALGGAVLGGVIAALFHALNLALGIASPTIQALRLHYVEFFTKFYEGGGAAFKPFKQGSE